MSHDEQAIRDLVRTWMDASLNGDVETVLSSMTDDVVFLVPGREPMRKSDFEAAARGQAGPGSPTFDGQSEIQEITVLGEWAFMWARLRVRTIAPDGQAAGARAGHTLSVLRKVNGRWRIARDANLLVEVPAESR